jgi:hypothetical protein
MIDGSLLSNYKKVECIGGETIDGSKKAVGGFSHFNYLDLSVLSTI